MQDRAASGQAGGPLHCTRVSHPPPVLPGRALRALFAALLLPGLLLAAAPRDARAQDAQAEGWSYEMWNELMSPYCPGRALSECPSPQAAELREWIVAQEAAGVSRARVETLLYERFGDQLRQAPRAEGVGLLAYVIPAGLTAVGALVVALFFAHVRRGRARTGEGPAAEPTSGKAFDSELARQVDAELAADEGR